MKKYISILLLLAAVISGCKKNGKDNPSTDLVGEWELEQISGGIPPKNFPSGEGNLAIFTNTGYEFYTKGALVASGSYAVMSDTTVVQNVCLVIPAGQFTRRIVYDNKPDSTKEFIDIIDGKLHFLGGCFALDGGHRYIYKRRSASHY